MASVGWKWTPVKLSQLRLSWVRFGWVRRFFSIWIKYTRNGCRSMGATNQIWASCRVSFFLSFAFDVEESGGPRLETFAAATFTIGLRAAPFATESIALAMEKKGQKKKKKKKKKKNSFADTNVRPRCCCRSRCKRRGFRVGFLLFSFFLLMLPLSIGMIKRSLENWETQRGHRSGEKVRFQ